MSRVADLWPAAQAELLELAGRRDGLAESGMWIELLRMCVRELLLHTVGTSGDGTGTLHLAPEYHAQGRHHARVRQDGFVRHQSSLTDLALQHTCAAERASSSRNQLVGGS